MQEKQQLLNSRNVGGKVSNLQFNLFYCYLVLIPFLAFMLSPVVSSVSPFLKAQEKDGVSY